MPVFENERGTYIFNSKDLCMIEYLPELLSSGADSLKIEGRMKTALYVATVARTYRKALDDYYESPEKYRENLSWYKEEIGKGTNRSFTTGFFFGKPTSNDQIYENSTYVTNYVYIGKAEGLDDKNRVLFMQKNKFCKGDCIEIMKPDGKDIETQVLHIYNDDMEEMDAASHASERLHVEFSVLPDKGNILRMKKEDA